MKLNSKIFIINQETRVTYINKEKKEQWNKWVKIKDLKKEEIKLLIKNEKDEIISSKIVTKKDKENYNLAEYPKNCILFDKDYKEEVKDEFLNLEMLKFEEKLKKEDINSFLIWRSRAGFHVLVPFENLENISEEIKKEIKKEFIKKYDCDLAKVSDRGVVSLPDKPHFKNNVIYKIKKEIFENNNKIKLGLLSICSSRAEEKKKILKDIQKNQEEDYKDFFEKDAFFNFIKNNNIPDGTNRDITLFPNLAYACVKTGKNKEEIDNIIKPIIEKNFPGKTYAEFEGWLKKAFDGQVNNYNKFVINKWFEDNNFKMPYRNNLNNNVFKLDDENNEDDEKKEDRLELIKDEEILELSSEEMEWYVQDLIPKGDICMLAGKGGSYKSSLMMHLAMCSTNNKLFMGKYKVQQGNVLFINEENHIQIIKGLYKRLIKGMSIEKTKGLFLSQERNLIIDTEDVSDLLAIAKKVLEKKIDLIIFDSLRRFVTFDENDATKTNNFFNKLKKFRKLCKYPTIILISHMKKSNPNNSGDIRDSIRGSADLTQASDSSIAINRKIGKESFIFHQIKCRGGLEKTKKLVLAVSGENKKTLDFVETDISEKAAEIKTQVNMAAEEILKIVENSNENIFNRKYFLEELKEKFSDTMIFKALKEMEEEGTVIKQGSGKNTVWVFSKDAEDNENYEENEKNKEVNND